MKTTLFLFLLFPSFLFAQGVRNIERLSKKSKCWVTMNDGFYGLSNNGVEILNPRFEEYYVDEGLVVFNGDGHSICYNAKGEKVLELSLGSLSVGEIPHYIIGLNDDGLSIYTLAGKQLVPFGKYYFDYYDSGVIIKNEETNELAFFDLGGKEVVPFSSKEIYYDDYEHILAVKYDSAYTVFSNENFDLPPYSSILDELTFVSDREVTVGEYLNFLGSQKVEGMLYDATAQHILDVLTLFPDTTKVEAKLLPLYRAVFPSLTSEEYGEFTAVLELASTSADIYVPFVIDKKLKPLLNFPVTGVSKYQAEKYCLWLQNQYMNHETKDYYSMVSFQLPTQEQWQKLAVQALRPENVQKQMPDSLNKENCMLIIYNSLLQCKNYSSYLKGSLGGGAVSVKSPILDMKGRSHVYGNVAEMTATEGVAKGGSFYHPASEARVSSEIKYVGPEPWLGFRIVGQYKIW